jgi:hypothetical protein
MVKGTKHSDETRVKIKAGIKEFHLNHPEWKEKIGAFHRGKKHSEEHKEKIRLAGLGRKHSEESKEKMSTSQINRYLVHPAPSQSQETIDKRANALRGQKRTDEQKKRISLSLLGRKLSEEHKKKLNLFRKGCRPWNLSGAIPISRNYAEYIGWRNAIYKRDDYTCQVCGQRGGRLAAHHILPYVKYPEYRHEEENGLTLCRECHRYAKRPLYEFVGYSNLEQEGSDGHLR